LALFWIYLFILAWIVVWKIGFPRIGDDSERFINLIPFYNATTGEWNTVRETAVNISIFIPFGLYMALLKPKLGIVWKVAPIIATSLVLEVFQFILAVGRSDISDLIANTLGGVVGIVLYSIAEKLFGKHTGKIFAVVLPIATLLVIIILLYLFTHIRYR
jgi:glycopeptide antibiotics resistance protein